MHSRTGLVGVWMTCRDYLKSMEAIRDSRSLKLATVFLALFLDNILLTVVVPIIPDYLMLLDSENRPGHSQLNGDREVTSASPVTFWNWSDVTSAYNWTGTDRFDARELRR
ncbi:hypothetical protein LSH36_799g01036 [Paralvinella palmiformis]|uniref:Uncharacterized protein n=1 Tax=Paralvinella palmiformis TaxID=53620 RepID=A0AAD9J0E2_9ANNE|nr:hypothetical protein LSH36_799g01036 [Paralvinella palmiformis]